jgi:uncharacterized protein YqeY
MGKKSLSASGFCSNVAKRWSLGTAGLQVNAVKAARRPLRPFFQLTGNGKAMIRDDIKAATIAAMKGGDKAGTSTLRMVQSAIKNRDIELRTGTAPADDDAMVTEVLQKMLKQRRESVDLYRQGAREELAAAEEAEIAIIERFLPKQLSDDEAKAAIATIIAETGASSMKDMGCVMGLVKERLGTSIEPARASGLVKAALA